MMEFSKCELSLHPQLERRIASAESAYDNIAQEAWIRVVFHDPTLSPVAVVGNDIDAAIKRLRAILPTYVTLPSVTARLRNDFDTSTSQRPSNVVKRPHIAISNATSTIARHPLVEPEGV